MGKQTELQVTAVKRIETRTKEKFFVNIQVYKEGTDPYEYEELFVYLRKDETRHVSQGEIWNGCLPLSKEWTWATKNWPNRKVEDLSESPECGPFLVASANILSKVRKNFEFGMKPEQVQEYRLWKKVPADKKEVAVTALKKQFPNWKKVEASKKAEILKGFLKENPQFLPPVVEKVKK